ncbi:hypothetical protein [Streptomyces erythrochromogenes]|uniref:hypothetical protein n=1 Tax=Streptomyces erythrochromogenes TaxID=285574 RepID=UPI0038708C62|nr:hypothetical protein OG364_29525 [Streptomyces erythrochromogenes]
MHTEPVQAVIRYRPVDEAAAALLGAPPHLDLTMPRPALTVPEPREGEELPPIRNRGLVGGIVRVIDNGPHFAEPGWTRITASPATDPHIRALLTAYPWIEELASIADKPLSGKVGTASYIAGGIALYRIAHPEHPAELWTDLYARLFRGALRPRDPAEAFRAAYFREKPETEPEAPAGRAERGAMKIQVGSTIRLLHAMTAAKPKAHPIGRAFYSLDETFPAP